MHGAPPSRTASRPLRPSRVPGWQRAWLAALAFALALPAAAALRASHVEIVLSVALDGSMLVRETHTVVADAVHGTPHRDLPAVVVPGAPAMDIEILRVAQGGQRLPWRTAPVDGALRVFFGGPQRRIPPGQRVYELLYHVDGHLARTSGREWLHWRPLGEGLAMPVASLVVEVTLPRPIPADHLVAVGGTTLGEGDAGSGAVTWRSVGPLPAGHGPSLLVGWPSGVLAVASDSEQAPWLRPRRTALAFAAVSLLLLAMGVVVAGRRQPLRRILPAVAGCAALAVLYLAGAGAAQDPGRFAVAWVLGLLLAAFCLLARGWLADAHGRPVYLVIATALGSAAVYLWVHEVSPWYPLLVLAHADLAWWMLLRARREGTRPAAPRTVAEPAGTTAPTAAVQGDRTARTEQPLPRDQPPRLAPLDDEGSEDPGVGFVFGDDLPDGRRMPYFDDPLSPRDPDDGISPPRDAGRRRQDASVPRRGPVRRY